MILAAWTTSLNELGATTNRGIQRVNVDDTDGIVITLVGLIGDVTTAITDAHAHGKVSALSEGSDVLLGVHELELRRDEEVRAGNLARAVDRDGRRSLVRGTQRTEHQALDVQDDIGDILDHVVDGHELVLSAIDLNRLDGSALKRGQQHATNRVAQRVAVAALERLDGNAGAGVVDLFDLNLGPNEF